MSTETGSRDKWFWKSGADLMRMIEEAVLTSQLRPFNDVLTGKDAPGGYGEPVLKDVEIDGRTCDVYHTDKRSNDSGHRVYIHIKE